jgi:hypothetical protein
MSSVKFMNFDEIEKGPQLFFSPSPVKIVLEKAGKENPVFSKTHPALGPIPAYEPVTVSCGIRYWGKIPGNIGREFTPALKSLHRGRKKLHR